MLAIDSKMNDIRIFEYENEMKEQVRTLFRSIYPDEPFMAEKMGYDVTLPNHITTKIALQGDSVIGNANLGFHVHPEKRLQGVAKSICLKAIETAKSKGITKVYIVTNKDNKGAIAVAGSIGFYKDNFRYFDEDMVVFLKIL